MSKIQSELTEFDPPPVVEQGLGAEFRTNGNLRGREEGRGSPSNTAEPETAGAADDPCEANGIFDDLPPTDGMRAVLERIARSYKGMNPRPGPSAVEIVREGRKGPLYGFDPEP